MSEEEPGTILERNPFVDEEHSSERKKIPEIIVNKDLHNALVQDYTPERRQEYNQLLFYWYEEAKRAFPLNVETQSLFDNPKSLLSPPPKLELPVEAPSLKGCIIDPVTNSLIKYPIPVNLRYLENAAALKNSTVEWNILEKEKIDGKQVSYITKIREAPIEALKGFLEEWRRLQAELVERQIQLMVYQGNKAIQTHLQPNGDPIAPYIMSELPSSFDRNSVLTSPWTSIINFTVEQDFYAVFNDKYRIGTFFSLGKENPYDLNPNILIFDLENINYTYREPLIFCPRNNYYFLIFDLEQKRFRFSEEPYELEYMRSLRSLAGTGDHFHLPLLKADVFLENLPNFIGKMKKEDQEAIIQARKLSFYKVLDDFIPDNEYISPFRTSLLIELEDLLLTECKIPFFDFYQNPTSIWHNFSTFDEDLLKLGFAPQFPMARPSYSKIIITKHGEEIELPFEEKTSSISSE